MRGTKKGSVHVGSHIRNRPNSFRYAFSKFFSPMNFPSQGRRTKIHGFSTAQAPQGQLQPALRSMDSTQPKHPKGNFNPHEDAWIPHSPSTRINLIKRRPKHRAQYNGTYVCRQSGFNPASYLFNVSENALSAPLSTVSNTDM